MTSEKVKEKVSAARAEVVGAICDLMEEKGLAWTCEWEGAAFMPHNGATERRYNGGNRLHLMHRALREGYDDARWYTYSQAAKLGYHPRKGEAGTIVEYWKMQTFGGGRGEQDGADEEPSARRVPVLMSYFNVFNACQLADAQGAPVPPPPERPMVEAAPELAETADMLVASSRCAVRESTRIVQACYKPALDVVEMPARTGFSSMEGFITTLAHEMSHATMKPLGREGQACAPFGSASYAFEELVAELGSTFCCIDIGVHRTAELEGDENFRNHAAYLKSWMQALRKDPDSLFRASAQADQAAKFIVERYDATRARTAPAAPQPSPARAVEPSLDRQLALAAAAGGRSTSQPDVRRIP